MYLTSDGWTLTLCCRLDWCLAGHCLYRSMLCISIPYVTLLALSNEDKEISPTASWTQTSKIYVDSLQCISIAQ
jgi:hypothetical protein